MPDGFDSAPLLQLVHAYFTQQKIDKLFLPAGTHAGKLVYT